MQEIHSLTLIHHDPVAYRLEFQYTPYSDPGLKLNPKHIYPTQFPNQNKNKKAPIKISPSYLNDAGSKSASS